nr:putative serine/threonine-protein kinase [Tanacetum cinerariifolium]
MDCPALKGTLKVLGSCSKASLVKRVVVTCSVAAVAYNDRPRIPKVVEDETWFFDQDICSENMGLFRLLPKTPIVVVMWSSRLSLLQFDSSDDYKQFETTIYGVTKLGCLVAVLMMLAMCLTKCCGLRNNKYGSLKIHASLTSGFGPVYLGKLRHGKEATIKVVSAESKHGAQEFLTEIEVVSDIEHENLAKLIGYCVGGNIITLVYDCIENNSSSQPLLGSGRSSIQFIHQDIKASNILLDKDLTPKISDFGLVKLIPVNMTHVSTRVAVTIGYLAPEYVIKGQLKRKADSYWTERYDA